MSHCVTRVVMCYAGSFMLLGWCVLFVTGLAVVGVASPHLSQEADRIEQLPTDYAALPLNAEAVVTGTLQNNPLLTSHYNQFPITNYALVAYEIDFWSITVGKNRSVSGHWVQEGQIVPHLRLDLDGHLLGTQAVTPAQRVEIRGQLHEFALPMPGVGKSEAKYHGEKLPSGSYRLRGFQNGDEITIVGWKGLEGRLIPQYIFMGTRVGLVADLRKESRWTYWGGVGLLIVLVFAGVIALRWLFKKRKGDHQSP